MHVVVPDTFCRYARLVFGEVYYEEIIEAIPIPELPMPDIAVSKGMQTQDSKLAPMERAALLRHMSPEERAEIVFIAP